MSEQTISSRTEEPEDIALLRKETRRFVDRALRPRTLEIERTREIPKELLDQLRELGYFGLTIPEKYGGMGLSTLAHLVVQEELGRAHASVNLIISGNNGIGVQGLILDGTEAQRQRWLPRLATGEHIAAFALTEPGAGSDAQAIETRAVLDGDSFVLDGTKHYISRGDVAQLFTVFAATDRVARGRGGITAFIVERGTPGFRVARIQESMGSDVVKQVELVFEGCRVPRDQVVGEVGQGFVTAMRILDLGRLSLAARCLGTMEELLTLSLRHAQTRVQFGKPLFDQQAVQHMLADTATEIAMLRPALYGAATRRDRGARVSHEASMLKLFASEALGRAADRGVQIHGGMGFMRDCPIEAIYREARSMRIVEGTSEVQRMLIARGLASDDGHGGGTRRGFEPDRAQLMGGRPPFDRLRKLLRRPGIRLRALDHDVRHELSGVRDSFAYLRHLARGNRIQRRKFFESIDEHRPPVLLLHGYFGTRGSMYMLERRLNDDGICVFSFNLGTLNVRDIRSSAFLIHRKIESILAQTPVKKIDIVGHSMGGLIGLYFIKKLGGHEKVRKLVMLGTPVKGTWAALLGVATLGLLSTSSWQLLPGSSFLRDLADGPNPRAVQYYSICADRDWVCPPASSVMEEASNVTVPLGHSSLVLSEEVYRHVVWALRQKGRTVDR